MNLNNKIEILQLIQTLKQTYPNATCSLNFKTPFELIIAVMLSAQCTDERVNLITPKIFATYKEPQDFISIDLKVLEELVHPCGFYKNKSKNIKLCAQKIVADFNGIVPSTMEDLTSLPGIGRKSANVILLEVFGIASGIAVDTHAKRISNRIGLSSSNSPEKIEQDLLKIIPHKYLKDINHLFVYHGRATCTARKPNCEACPIKNICNYYNNYF